MGADRKSDRGVRKGPPPPTYATFRRELDQLAAAWRAARAGVCRYVRYERVVAALEKSGLPYRLVQETRDDTGRPVRGYRYRFTSDFNGPAALYIQETRAGRMQYRTPAEAIGALDYVLNERAHEAHRREFYAGLAGCIGT